jgi:hypothetical protein
MGTLISTARQMWQDIRSLLPFLFPVIVCVVAVIGSVAVFAQHGLNPLDGLFAGWLFAGLIIWVSSAWKRAKED